MFCGIVAHTGIVEAVEPSLNARRYLIRTQFDDLTEGESISVDGVCLTVTEHDKNRFYCDVSPETLDKTNVGAYHVGDEVNIERAMQACDRIGGHIVTGHVDDTATLMLLETMGDFVQLTFQPADLSDLKYVVAKGCIAINGVSLTINSVDDVGFRVMLIVHTLSVTNLKNLEVGHCVNIEYDMLAKIVAKQVEKMVIND